MFWGKVSEIAEGQMPNKITGATDFLTVAGSPYTFQVPNTAPYIAADTDYIWFKTDASQRTTTTAELIGYDFSRTIVKYLDVSPYTLEEVIILKSGQVLTTDEMNKLRDYAHLSTWWDGTLSLYGYTKGNRAAERSIWTPEVVDIVDADGNVYTEVTIGTQTWLVENLQTTKYNDGAGIPNLTVDGDWAADTSGAYRWHANNVANKSPYGALYNWYALNTNKLHISGYHIPSAAEFTTLNNYLNGLSAGTVGGQMKESGTTHWATPNTGANNSSGFTGVPSSYVTNIGAFGATLTQYGGMWIKEQVDATNGKIYYLSYNDDDLNSVDSLKKFGRPVRLIKD